MQLLIQSQMLNMLQCYNLFITLVNSVICELQITNLLNIMLPRMHYKICDNFY